VSPICATTIENHALRSHLGKTPESKFRSLVACESFFGTAIQVRPNRRPFRPAAAPTGCGKRIGFFTLERTLPRLSGAWADDEYVCPYAAARVAGWTASVPGRSISAWRVRLHAYQAAAKVEAGFSVARFLASISTFSCLCRRMSSSSAMAADLHCPRADPMFTAGRLGGEFEVPTIARADQWSKSPAELIRRGVSSHCL